MNNNNLINNKTIAPSYSISRVIKGGWQLAGGHGAIDRARAVQDMFAFAESGITTFDCADIYTGVEEMIGEFRKEYKKRYGVRRLNQIKVHTKFVPDLQMLSHISKQYVESIIDRSLERLSMERLDLVQFHWWDYTTPQYIETANYLKELQKKGKIKHIGVTNFDVVHLKEIVESGVKIVSTQNQYSVIDKRPENKMVQYCQQNDIALLCYGTVAGGFLSERYLGTLAPKEPYENRSLTKYRLIIDDFGGWELFQELLQVLKDIGKKNDVNIATVASRYILEKERVAAVIVGARNRDHLNETLKLFSFELTDNDKNKIKTILKEAKGPVGDTYYLERLKKGKHATIMKYNLNKE